MRRNFTLALALIVAVLFTAATAKPPRRRRYSRHRSGAAQAALAKAAAEKTAAEIRAGRERIAAQIKTLTRFVYLFGGIEKTIELAAPAAAANRDTSPVAVDQTERSKARIRASISNVRQGLEKLETDFRGNPAFKSYYPYLTGIGDIGEAAENRAAANRFDDAGRILLKAVDQLADALAAMR